MNWPTVGFYRCYSMSFMNKKDEASINELQSGGKIILPQSALEIIAFRKVSYPLLFQLRVRGRPLQRTHCGVLEFTAEEGRCYVPFWMQQQLLAKEGDVVEIVSVSLQVASSIKLQPHSSNFLDITDHRAVLENVMTKYSAVTEDDAFCILYNRKTYWLTVRKVMPQNALRAASIIETDVAIEFDPPMDYKEPAPDAARSTNEDSTDGALIFGGEAPSEAPAAAPSQPQQQKSFEPFSGHGLRLDGKQARAAPVVSQQQRSSPSTSPAPQSAPAARAVPAAQQRPAAPAPVPAPAPAPAPAGAKKFVPFGGQGHRLNS